MFSDCPESYKTLFFILYMPCSVKIFVIYVFSFLKCYVDIRFNGINTVVEINKDLLSLKFNRL